MAAKTTSITPDGNPVCQPIGTWTILCYEDLPAILGIVLLASYFIAHLISLCKIQLAGYHALGDDEEKAQTEPQMLADDTDTASDPHSPTLRLHRFIHRSARGNAHSLVPPTTLFPRAPPSSPYCSPDTSFLDSPTVARQRDNQLHERLRLARFRFPSREPAVRPVDLPDVFSPERVKTLESEGDLFTSFYGGMPGGGSFGMLNFEDAVFDE